MEKKIKTSPPFESAKKRLEIAKQTTGSQDDGELKSFAEAALILVDKRKDNPGLTYIDSIQISMEKDLKAAEKSKCTLDEIRAERERFGKAVEILADQGR